MIELLYLNIGGIGGRGGVVRFFMLANDMAFTETLIPPGDEWQTKKAELVATAENPAGTVPVVKTDGKTLTQHVAIMRYLAGSQGLSSGDYANDAVADQYQAFRDAWVTAAFMGGDKDKFKAHAKAELKVFNELYVKYATADVYLSSAKPLWGDVAIASLIRDLVLTDLFDAAELQTIAPRLATMYQAFLAIPAIKVFDGLYQSSFAVWEARAFVH